MNRFFPLFVFALLALVPAARAFQGQQPIASNYNDTRTFICADDTITGSNLRVKLTGGRVTLAGAGEQAIGLSVGCGATSQAVLVRLIPVGTIRVFAAAGPVSAGDAVYGAAGGQAGNVSAGNRIGVALQNAVNSGDLIEVMVLDAGVTGSQGPTGPTGPTGATGATGHT